MVKNHSCYFTVVPVSLTLVLISAPDSVHGREMRTRSLAVHPLVSEQVFSIQISVTLEDRFDFERVPVDI